MSRTLNFISTNVQGYGPSETTSLPCFGVSRRAISISPCLGSEFKSFQVKVVPVKCSLKHKSFVCKAGSGGQRRNPDFPRQNRHIFSRNRNRYNEERDSSENLDESEFVSTKNGPILSLSDSPKANATATPGQREREIVELFRKVQAQLRERAAVKEEKRFEAVKGQNKESETVDSLLKLLRKHSAEQGKRKVNGGNASEFSYDRPRQSGKSDGDNRRTFSPSKSIAKDEPQETTKLSVGRPVSSFRRRSPVPRVKYEPIISTEDTYESVTQPDSDVNTDEAHYKPVPDFDSDSEADLEIESGLDLEEEEEEEEEEVQEDEEEEEPEVELEIVGKSAPGELSDSEPEVLNTLEDAYDEKDSKKLHTEIRDVNAMKLTELRALAKARGIKGFSKLKKSELVGLLCDDSSLPW